MTYKRFFRMTRFFVWTQVWFQSPTFCFSRPFLSWIAIIALFDSPRLNIFFHHRKYLSFNPFKLVGRTVRLKILMTWGSLGTATLAVFVLNFSTLKFVQPAAHSPIDVKIKDDTHQYCHGSKKKIFYCKSWPLHFSLKNIFVKKAWLMHFSE